MTPDEPSRQPSRGGAAKLGGGAAIVAALALAYGVYGHYAQHAEAEATLRQLHDFVPAVRVAAAKRNSDAIQLSLPGTTDAFDLASVNARATGYIGKRFVDIGSRVTAGEALAVIDSPDLDRQLDQARSQLLQTQAALTQAQATLQQIKANYDLASVTNTRYSTLVQQGWETKQTGDTYRLQLQAQAAAVQSASAAVGVAQANQTAQESAVRRLEQLAGYEQVTAPFDGVVTVRNIDVGDLVTADTASARSLFVIARDNVLRVRIDIPQSAVDGLADGLSAEVTVPDTPGRSFTGKVARNAVALAAGSRTLRTEVDVDNADHALRPGLYVNVRLTVPRRAPSVILPAEALIFDDRGMQVATVVDGTVQLHPVVINRDFGTSVEIADGLQGGETVILSPYANIADGQKVKVRGTGQPATSPIS